MRIHTHLEVGDKHVRSLSQLVKEISSLVFARQCDHLISLIEGSCRKIIFRQTLDRTEQTSSDADARKILVFVEHACVGHSWNELRSI